MTDETDTDHERLPHITQTFPCSICDTFPFVTIPDLIEHVLRTHSADDLGKPLQQQTKPSEFVQVPSNFGTGKTTRRPLDQDPASDADKATLRDLLKLLEGNDDAEAIREIANIARASSIGLRHGTVTGWIKELRTLAPTRMKAPAHPEPKQHAGFSRPERAPIPTPSPGTYTVHDEKYGISRYKVEIDPARPNRRIVYRIKKDHELMLLSPAAQIAVLFRIGERK